MYADLFRLNRFFDIIQQLERLTKITNETFTVILYSFETIYIYILAKQQYKNGCGFF